MMSETVPRLKKKYHDDVVGLLMKEFKFGNPMEEIGRASCRERV